MHLLQRPYLRPFTGLGEAHVHKSGQGEIASWIWKSVWSWSSFNGNSPQSDALCDLVYRHNLLQIVDFPTHLKGGILDLIFTNSEHLVANTTSFSSPFLLSDHFPISFSLSCVSRKARVSSTTYSFNLKKNRHLRSFFLSIWLWLQSFTCFNGHRACVVVPKEHYSSFSHPVLSCSLNNSPVLVQKRQNKTRYKKKKQDRNALRVYL